MSRDRERDGATSRTLVGGVGYRWQRDASFGLVATDWLSSFSWPDGTDILDLGYGAIYAAQDIGDATPSYGKAVFLAAAQRGREKARLYRRAWEPFPTPPDEVQERIREAGAGVIDLDHLLVIAQHLGALPGEVVVIEVEPVDTRPGEELSEGVAALLPETLDLVRRMTLPGTGAGTR